MKLSVHSIKGKETSKKVDLLDEVFGIDPNDHAIYLDVKRIAAGWHRGTHKVKARADVSGSTRKLRRQKGSGAARLGSIKNPLFRGGGTAFGPVVHEYSNKLNKKVKSLAKKSALSYKAKENNLIILEDFNFEAPKTKSYIEILDSLNIYDKKTLLVLESSNYNIYKSASNIPETRVTHVEELNTYDIVNAERLILVEASIKKLENTVLRIKTDEDPVKKDKAGKAEKKQKEAPEKEVKVKSINGKPKEKEKDMPGAKAAAPKKEVKKEKADTTKGKDQSKD